MSKAVAERSIYVSAGLLVVAVVIYAYWLSNRAFQLIDPPSEGPVSGLLFNSMLAHMVHGRFDVDPATAAMEGFARGGHTYVDWGIFPTLIRIPLLFFRNGLELDITRLSTLIAVTTAATMKMSTLRLIFRSVTGAGAAVLYWALLLALLFGGAQVEFLKTSVYQEECLWAGALGAGFVFLAIRGLIAGRFSVASLCGMAAIAGAAMLSRATIGVGLCSAVVWLLLVNHGLATSAVDGSVQNNLSDYIRRLVVSRRFLLPATVLLVFGVVVGFLNYEHWGNPLLFVDYHRYFTYLHSDPERLVRLDRYGVFNPTRIPFALIYYFFPIWVLQRTDGQQLFYEHETRLFDSVELPPSSFLLTDTLLLALLAVGFWALARQRRLPLSRPIVLTIAAGLGVSCLFILSFNVLAFRYRIDFHPFIEFGAFVGVTLMLQSPNLARAGISRALVAASALSIIASNFVLILYRHSDFGTAVDMKRDILHFYLYAFGPYLSHLHL